MAAGAQEIPPVYFNHTTIWVTPETYDALKASPLINNEFAASTERTVQAEGGKVSYTGIYVEGSHTYIELFKSGPSFRPPPVIVPPGRVNIGMSIDHRTQLPVLRDRLG